MFFCMLTNNTIEDTSQKMEAEQQQQQQQIRIRNCEENGMNAYDRYTDEWNRSVYVQQRHMRRNEMINNTNEYDTGDYIHHIRTIQMPTSELWNELFGREILNQNLREYAQASMNWVQDETDTLLFAGQMEVSLLMQENFRPGVHIAIFIVHLVPHRSFHDGHMIQIEFGEGSNTHRTIDRLFDTNTRAIVLQATEYQLLGFLADDDEASELLQDWFMDPDFNPMRFSLIEPENIYEDVGYYVVDPMADDEHRWHECGAGFAAAANHRIVDEDDDIINEPISIPPPPPVNDFNAIYQRHFNMFYDSDNDNDIDIGGDDDDLPATG